MWGLYITHFVNNYVVYSIVAFTPQWMMAVQGDGITLTGQLAAIPSFLMLGVAVSAGIWADYLINNMLTTASTRVLMQSLYTVITSMGFIIAGWTSPGWVSVIVFLIANAAFAFAHAGFAVNFMDVSPHYGQVRCHLPIEETLSPYLLISDLLIS